MAFASPAITFTLLIATVSCLMLTTAEEIPDTPETRESKQLFIAPQFYPANSQYYYPENGPYGNPFGVPAEGSFVNNYPLPGARLSTYPSAYSPLDDPSIPIVRHVHTGGHDHLKWKKKHFRREANINIAPAETECSVIPPDPWIVTDGLGPCKIATQAEQGSITIAFTAPDQAAFIAITADSQRNTRVRLVCTEMSGLAPDTVPKLFTQTGEVKDVTDTPRTEIGYMQIVVVSRDDANFVKCNWHSYHHYTGLYP